MGFFFVVAILMSLTLSSERVKKEMTRADKGEGVEQSQLSPRLTRRACSWPVIVDC